MSTVNIIDLLTNPFDVIIIGGGTAGLVLATRLSEEPGVQVGVIEAGSFRLDDPKQPDYDWNFESIPQAGTSEKAYHLPRGKMLGGSSGINFMSYNRPCAEGLNDWAEKLGIKGWRWSALVPYFKQSENLEPVINTSATDCPVNLEAHGINGPIHASIGSWQPPIEESLLAAFDEAAHLPRPVEPYSGDHLGFYRSLFTINRTSKPVRSYAAKGYFASVMGRPNLKVLENAQVCRFILSDASDGTLDAEGVGFHHMGKRHVVSAKRGLILSAGSFQGPQLLELSGIGDPHVLEQAGIVCRVANVDVGNNLQEHTMYPSLYAKHHSGALSGSLSLMGFIPYSSHADKMDTTISRIFSTSTVNSGGLAQQNINYQRQQQEVIASRMQSPRSANIQFIGIPAYFNTSTGHQNFTKVMSSPPVGYYPCYSIFVSNMYPVSRGEVHVWTSNPLDAPAIDPGFLSHPVDVDFLATGTVFVDQVFQSKLLNGKIGRRVSPPAGLDLADLEEARRFVRDNIMPYHHPLGTCAIGQVVDERLRVKGVRRLRVVDASVMPMQVSATIMATVYAIAERASDIIKEALELGGSTACDAMGGCLIEGFGIHM
ncbi:hypothetical protein ASPZODRAFT_2129226 [Penicilliopsis zonata CBS 506.65]|uniref:Glucose-methanol-choline oxidoreductase N-terminal domain-containing protein n=1 Tax=Penicilliopsis zonata CBS 506.65 TaxID=1073090 RepID=A0A1L9SJN7_9EURO|nr:hypothetical protein ASPZODRAFT_2129226 [Penicilliopsis zonata CBS 506.65]OJJ47408.1 hypothetical protein ASPZODRAFT_2129226 [Penicilliopsis zonata CBS 506.65]